MQEGREKESRGCTEGKTIECILGERKTGKRESKREDMREGG